MRATDLTNLKKYKYFSSGFTIIELLVVITLVGIVSGIGIFSMVSYGNTQLIEQSVGSIKGMFDEAKFNAVSSVKLEANESGEMIICDTNLAAYRVDVLISSVENDSLELYMVCDNSEELVKTFSLPSDLNMGVGTTCDEVIYEAVRLQASGLPLLPCDIDIEGFDQTRTIRIDKLGNVNII